MADYAEMHPYSGDTGEDAATLRAENSQAWCEDRDDPDSWDDPDIFDDPWEDCTGAVAD